MWRSLLLALALPACTAPAPESFEDRQPPKPESAYETRERLRAERSRMVGEVARRTGQSHREIQGRINRETKVKAVANATIGQLERGNEILRRDLWR